MLQHLVITAVGTDRRVSVTKLPIWLPNRDAILSTAALHSLAANLR